MSYPVVITLFLQTVAYNDVTAANTAAQMNLKNCNRYNLVINGKLAILEWMLNLYKMASPHKKRTSA